jgi:peptidyl-tRNA hydrolase, PTH1 family
VKMVVGLGNPGAKYRDTPHNLGYRAVEEFCRRRGFRWIGSECQARTAGGRVSGERVLVACPETYMNGSGESVAGLIKGHRVPLPDLLVVCDDVALELGRLRVRPGGSDGGHLGLRSITEWLESERFPRLRIGIRSPEAGGGDLAEQVLTPFDRRDREAVEAGIDRAAECIEWVLEKGIQPAMNHFNRRPRRDPDGPEVDRNSSPH